MAVPPINFIEMHILVTVLILNGSAAIAIAEGKVNAENNLVNKLILSIIGSTAWHFQKPHIGQETQTTSDIRNMHLIALSKPHRFL